jgi:hypothetical protein
MATRKAKVHGPTTKTVAANIRRLRQRQGWSVPKLSARTEELGYEIPAEALHKIEAAADDRPGARRINVDELMTLASAFGMSPNALMLPPTVKGDTEVTGVGEIPARDAWKWVRGRSRLPRERDLFYTSGGDDADDQAWDRVDAEKDLQFRRENMRDEPTVALPLNMTPEQMNQLVTVTEEMKKAGRIGLNTKAVANYAQSHALADRMNREAQQRKEERRAKLTPEERAREDAQREEDRQIAHRVAEQLLREEPPGINQDEEGGNG